MAQSDPNKPKKKRKSSKVKIWAERMIILCLFAIVVFSGWKIYSILHDYDSNQGIYDTISDTAKTEEKDDGFKGDIDFASLREINPDIVGWLYYEGTKIDYPVVQGPDNEKYLRSMFDGSYSGFGTLFVDAITEAPFEQFNTIIYGHHMLNGSMFGDLKKLKESKYCKKHPQFELITPEGKYHLMICAFLNQPSDSDIYLTNFNSDDNKKSYIDLVNRDALYVTSEKIKKSDRLVILSTCAYEYQNARYMVVTKMVPWEEE